MKKPTLKQAVSIGMVLIFVGFFLWGRTVDAAEANLGVGFSFNGAGYQQVTFIDSERKWYASATRIGGDRRHNYVYGRLAVGYRVNWRKYKRVSPYIRLGGVYFTEEPTDYISDDFAFDMAIGSRLWQVVELEYQHNSTAGRSNQNEGLDAVMLSVVLPFGS